MKAREGSDRRRIPAAVRNLATSLVAFNAVFLLSGDTLRAGQLEGPSIAPNQHSLSRSYKASVYVSLFSIQIFSRSSVGLGFASLEETQSADEETFSLQFFAGSDPKRAHGLNRIGYLEETVRSNAHAVKRADYFGLITHSGEESFEQARASLTKNKGASVGYVVSRAALSGGTGYYVKDAVREPSSYGPSNAAQLVQAVRAEFDTAHHQSVTTPLTDDGTFLYCLLEAIRSKEQRTEKQFFYNGTIFRLVAEKKADFRAGEEFAKAGLTGTPQAVQQLAGTIRSERTGLQTNFHLWFDSYSDNVLPLRFEFRPRTFLRLVFDARSVLDAAGARPISMTSTKDVQR